MITVTIVGGFPIVASEQPQGSFLVCKEFDGTLYWGRAQWQGTYYHVYYADGDEEDMTPDEFKTYRRTPQNALVTSGEEYMMLMDECSIEQFCKAMRADLDKYLTQLQMYTFKNKMVTSRHDVFKAGTVVPFPITPS